MAIQLEEVSFSYGKKNSEKVIKNINLAVCKEGLTALIGPNGSGKTTLGKLVAGIFKPTLGRVLIDGQDTRDLSLGKIGQKIGYVFQDPERQIFAPTVREELSFILELKGFNSEEVNKKVETMLSRFHLSELKEEFPFYLSRGEKQRLALAAVLINDPPFLILDEPTTALDIKRKGELQKILKDLLDRGIGMLVISHDHKFVKRYADRVLEMAGGEIFCDKEVGEKVN